MCHSKTTASRAAQALAAPEVLRIVGEGTLLAFGMYKLLALRRASTLGRVRGGFRDLTAWSFLGAWRLDVRVYDETAAKALAEGER